MINGYEANRETGPTPLRGEALGRARSSAIYHDAIVAYELSQAANAYLQSLHRPQVEAMGAASVAQATSTFTERRPVSLVTNPQTPIEQSVNFTSSEIQMPPVNPNEPTSPAIEEARRLVMDAFATVEQQKAA